MILLKPLGLGSTALVLSIAAPFGGSYWYALTLLSPLAGGYYWQRGSRVEEVAVRVLLCSTFQCPLLQLQTMSAVHHKCVCT